MVFCRGRQSALLITYREAIRSTGINERTAAIASMFKLSHVPFALRFPLTRKDQFGQAGHAITNTRVRGSFRY